MKSNAWRQFLDEQRVRHRKVLYTVTELANVADTSRSALNVELSRLREQGMLQKYAHGLYGPPGSVTVEMLVPAIDPHAYITGHYALRSHNLVTQLPTAITCFTDRRSPRARQRITPVGRLVFVCVRSPVYCPDPENVIVSPGQALCDYVYLSRRQGVRPEAVVSFRNFQHLQVSDLSEILVRYPRTVQEHVCDLVQEHSINKPLV